MLDMINVVSKKYDPDESKMIKEYLKNDNFDIPDKSEGFEVYYSEGAMIGEVK